MKNKIFKIISCIITILITVLLLLSISKLTERKSSLQKYSDFLSRNEDFDVYFMGTSHVINGIFPMELWNDYGIVSYNFGGHGNQIATSYWVMRNAIEKSVPKVVVIDCLGIERNYKCSDKFSYLHMSLDAFPLSKIKLAAIWDLLDDPILESAIANNLTRESNEPRTKIGLLWDYSVYHSRWNDLTMNDFILEKSYEKGAESRINVSKGDLNRISSNDKILSGTVSDIYLRKAIEYCQANNIDVVLTYLPFPATKEQQMGANYVYDVSKEYNIDYLNFLDTNTIDFKTDLFDEDSHLNPSGARKITKQLGEYLSSHYNLADKRKSSEYNYWNKDYAEYVDNVKNANLIKTTNIQDYLMLLYDDDIDFLISIGDISLTTNSQFSNLISNIGVDVDELNMYKKPVDISQKAGILMLSDGSFDSESYGDCSVRIDVYRDSLMIDSVEFKCLTDAQTGELITISASHNAF